jgi:hypothetical protein
MKFSLVFPSEEAWDLCVGLIFIPCAAWYHGEKILWIPHPSNPHYLTGDFQALLNKLESKKLLHYSQEDLKRKKIFIIIHNVGHGTEKYLSDLVKDIINADMIPVIVNDA